MALTEKKCVPCEGGSLPLSDENEDALLQEITAWNLVRDDVHKLQREFSFKDFKEAMVFVNKLADLAEQEGHHPNIIINYNKVKVELFTHAINGLSENDFIVAAKIDQML